MKVQSKEITEDVYVMKSDTAPLLGLQAAIKLDLIRRNGDTPIKVNTVQKSLTLDFIRSKHSEVFDGSLGEFPDCYKIQLTEDAQPRVNAPRRIPHSMMLPLKNRLDDMRKRNVIEPVDHPTDWVNSMVATEKKDGSLRICLDPRHLNQYVKREHFTIPTFQEIVSQLKKPKFFTIIDQSSAFWQIKLHEESRDLTTFQTPFGRFRLGCLLVYAVPVRSNRRRQCKSLVIFRILTSSTMIC